MILCVEIAKKMMIVYVDIILLVILLVLTISTCGYCVYKLYRMHQTGQVGIMLQPTKVLFSHKKDDCSEELRTVVAYRNPLTGDYCVHKNPKPKGYVNAGPHSPDSGLSDEYEPLNLDPQDHGMPGYPSFYATSEQDYNMPKTHLYHHRRPEDPEYVANSLNKTWNWNYKEYQI